MAPNTTEVWAKESAAATEDGHTHGRMGFKGIGGFAGYDTLVRYGEARVGA